MKLLIAGSRSVWPSVDEIQHAIVAHVSIDDPITTVVSGNANGADLAGEEWALARNVAIERFPVLPADIKKFGKYLGPRQRNRRMADAAHMALVFWDGYSGGSADMTTRMVARFKPVVVLPFRKLPADKLRERTRAFRQRLASR